MRKNRWLLMGALAVVISIAGCNCDPIEPDPGTEQDAGPGAGQDGGPDVGQDGGPDVGQDAGQDSGVVVDAGRPIEPQPDGGIDGRDAGNGPGSACVPSGGLCSRQNGAACCTGVCGVDGVCPPPSTACHSSGESCSVGGDCCTNSCLNGKCAYTQCQDVGASCTTAEQCCTKTCTGGKCAPLADTSYTCKVLGQACTAAADCCSTNCQNGICARSYTCKAYGDLCTRDVECCGNECSVTDGGVGRCLQVKGGGSGGCTQDGNPCAGGSNCCSKTCVDLGYGATVCQPLGGCKVTGNYCTGDAICCGSGTVSNVTCTDGRCNNGNACEPTGNVCGSGKLPDGGIVSVPAKQACCDGQKEVCKVDPAGVPRCYGGYSSTCPSGYDRNNPACCLGQDSSCQFSDQCCNGTLCLPDAQGNLKCRATSGGGGTSPDGGTTGGTCSPVGTRCDGDAGVTCCAGTECRASSELTKACQSTYTPPPPATDGGTADAGTGTTDGGGGTCSANGATCTGGSQCCSGICSSGKCSAPAVCQPQNGLCTTNADCCSGLSCDVPLGSNVGSCQLGSVCSTSGQACSPTVGCCSGLSCRNTVGALCDGTSACTCRVIIN